MRRQYVCLGQLANNPAFLPTDGLAHLSVEPDPKSPPPPAADYERTVSKGCLAN
jgi:hypothetical protein